MNADQLLNPPERRTVRELIEVLGAYQPEAVVTIEPWAFIGPDRWSLVITSLPTPDNPLAGGTCAELREAT